ncbi:MAG: hypothetical protein ACREAK_02435, partial [Nitrosarchaeum sp.]
TVIVPACNGSVPLEWNFVPQRADDYIAYAKVTSGYDIQNSITVFDEPYVGTSFQVRINVSGIFIDKTVYSIIESPLKQFKSGISLDKFQCKETLQLMIKNNGNPACVKSDSFEKLWLRGWGDCAWNCSHPIPVNIIEQDRELAYLDKTMEVQRTDHFVKYGIGGNATVIDSIYSEDSASVIITLDTMTSGSLTIELPRTLIDSGHSNCDPRYEREEPFVVLENHEEVYFEEIETTSEKRTILIPFQENTSEIEIIAFCLI